MDLNRLKIDRVQAAPAAQPPRRARGRGRWFSRLVLLALLAVAGWLFRQPILDFVDRLRLPQVTTARVVKPSAAAAGAVMGTASNGYIVARTRAALSADTPGRVIEMNVEEGQAVEKGFVVARLFADELEAAVRRAEADLAVSEAGVERLLAEVASAESDLSQLGSARDATRGTMEEAEANLALAEVHHRRIQKLVEDGIETAQALDETEATLRSARARVQSTGASLSAAEAALASGRSRIEVTRAAVTEARATSVARRASAELARATLDKTIIRAPFDGIVVLKNAEVGEVVSPNSQAGSNARGSVATMVDFSSLEVQAEVPETSLSAVKVGAPARIFLDAFPDRPYSGKVERIWPTADRQKATIEVR
ncbi:MAG: HlyD family efflux transporter periplasmic adaptor subunit, partial [Planctomycetota bacterium]